MAKTWQVPNNPHFKLMLDHVVAIELSSMRIIVYTTRERPMDLNFLSDSDTECAYKNLSKALEDL